MAMSVTWTLMVTASLVCGAACGTLGDVTAAAMEGASAAVELTLSMAGALCLWSGVMTVMERGGVTEGLARLFRPLLRRILPRASQDADTLAAVSANVSANLLGLGNAATPLGIRAAQRMAAGCGGVASDELCRLVVLNTASIQLLPTTVAAVRSAHGCTARWISSRRCGCHRCCRWRQGCWPPGFCSGSGGRSMDIASLLIPLLLTAAALWALRKRIDVYDALTSGAAEGLLVLARIAPSLIALLTAVYMLRASGALTLLTRLLTPVLERLGIPPETAALLLVRPVSGSGALAVGSELMAAHGPDSYIGRCAAVMLGCTETTFYTIAVYFGAAGIRRTRYTVPAALTADLVGFMAAAWSVRLFFGT